MNAIVIVAIVTCVGTLITVLGAFWVAKINSKKDTSINHRIRLSEDEQRFRTDLITEVDSYRDKIEALMGKVDKLSEENAELKGINIKLMAKMDIMQESLNRFSSCSSSSTETHTVITQPIPVA